METSLTRCEMQIITSVLLCSTQQNRQDAAVCKMRSRLLAALFLWTASVKHNEATRSSQSVARRLVPGLGDR